MAEPISIDKRTNLSVEEFRNEYVLKRRPVVLTDASRAWKIHDVISPQWLRENHGKQQVGFGGGKIDLSDLLDLLEFAEPDQPIPYPITIQLEDEWPELMAYLDPLPLPHAMPNRLVNPLFRGKKFGSKTEIFLGGNGGNFPYAHVDYYHLHAWINMLVGVKRFWVFATDDPANLYPEPPDNWRSTVLNVFDPDYEKYPLMKKVQPSSIEVGPGETLYIPSGTWHSAQSTSFTISVAFDQLNDMNMSSFVKDVMTFKELSVQDRIKYGALYAVVGTATTVLEKLSHKAHRVPALRGII